MPADLLVAAVGLHGVGRPAAGTGETAALDDIDIRLLGQLDMVHVHLPGAIEGPGRQGSGGQEGDGCADESRCFHVQSPAWVAEAREPTPARFPQHLASHQAIILLSRTLGPALGCCAEDEGVEDSPKWLTAADCAARTGLTVRALRVYEREGLLKPSRAANGWRRYGPEDLMRLNSISVVKALGLSLSMIGKLLRENQPSLLNVLKVQAESWRERRGEATQALELVEAAIHRLERNQQPSLEELCALVNALQARSNPMQNRANLMMDLMTELLSAEERVQWQNWWAANSDDMNQNTAYLLERTECFAVMLEQLQQGLSPEDPAVQEQVAKQAALVSRYGVRERTLRLMNWNLELTTKFMEMGTIARERQPDSNVLPFPALGQKAATFLEQAMFASAPARAAMAVLGKVQALIESQLDPLAPEATAVVQEFAQLCAQHDLGDPAVYVRFMPFIAHVN